MAIATAALLPLRPALAQSTKDVEAARALFVEASRLADAGRWDDARERYLVALKLRRAAIILYSLGVVDKELGRLTEAKQSFEEFLREPSTPATSSYEVPASQAIIEIDARLAKLEITLSPAAVEHPVLTLDGVALPEVPAGEARRIDPGAHTLVAQAPGRRDARVEFKVGDGATYQAALTLAPLVDAASPAPKIVLAPAPTPGDSSHAPSTGVAPHGPVAGPSRAVPFTLIGAGGVVFIAGVTTGLLGLSAAGNAPSSTGPEASAARTKGVVGDVLAGAGIATAGAGVILLLVQNSHAPSRSSRVQPWIGVASAGVSGRF